MSSLIMGDTESSRDLLNSGEPARMRVRTKTMPRLEGASIVKETHYYFNFGDGFKSSTVERREFPLNDETRGLIVEANLLAPESPIETYTRSVPSLVSPDEASPKGELKNNRRKEGAKAAETVGQALWVKTGVQNADARGRISDLRQKILSRLRRFERIASCTDTSPDEDAGTERSVMSGSGSHPVLSLSYSKDVSDKNRQHEKDGDDASCFGIDANDPEAVEAMRRVEQLKSRIAAARSWRTRQRSDGCGKFGDAFEKPFDSRLPNRQGGSPPGAADCKSRAARRDEEAEDDAVGIKNVVAAQDVVESRSFRPRTSRFSGHQQSKRADDESLRTSTVDDRTSEIEGVLEVEDYDKESGRDIGVISTPIYIEEGFISSVFKDSSSSSDESERNQTTCGFSTFPEGSQPSLVDSAMSRVLKTRANYRRELLGERVRSTPVLQSGAFPTRYRGLESHSCAWINDTATSKFKPESRSKYSGSASQSTAYGSGRFETYGGNGASPMTSQLDEGHFDYSRADGADDRDHRLRRSTAMLNLNRFRGAYLASNNDVSDYDRDLHSYFCESLSTSSDEEDTRRIAVQVKGDMRINQHDDDEDDEEDGEEADDEAEVDGKDEEFENAG